MLYSVIKILRTWSVILLYCILIICSNSPVHAQEITIETVSIDAGKVVVRYVLVDEDINHRYTLHLYTSRDDFTQPMQQVSGDIGINLTVGGNKTLTWDAREEFGINFQEEIKLELKGQRYIPFIELNDFESYKAFKRGREYPITWSGGRGDNVLNWELYNGKDEKMYTFPQIPNVGNYSLVFPDDIKPGKEYKFRISDSRNLDEVVFSSPFTIRRRLPLGVKTFIGVAMAAGIYAVIGVLSPEPEQEDLVDPTGPPNQNE